jgi:hypothetical protein
MQHVITKALNAIDHTTHNGWLGHWHSRVKEILEEVAKEAMMEERRKWLKLIKVA